MSAPAEHWIVVGAGSAGCVVAARLAEDDGRTVTLLEAGPDLPPDDVPASIDGLDFLAALAEPGRLYDDLVVTRQPGTVPVRYPRGRGVGGSSAVNALIGLRGDDAEGWGWDGVDDAWARLRLPIEAAGPDELGAVDRALLAAAPDARPAPLTRAGSRRVTAAEAYLWPARARPNLTVRAGALVDRVILDGRRGAGVRLADGTEVAADRIVLCAGALHTPAILLRSRVDTPGVGEGLQDHPSAPITLVLRPDRERPRGTEHGLVVGSLLQRGVHQVLPMNRLAPSGRSAGDAGQPAAEALGLLMVALMRPRGTAGRVALASDDPEVDPAVDFHLLADPADLAELRRGVHLLLALLDHEAFRSIVTHALIDPSGTGIEALVDDAAIDRWLRGTCGDYVHASSSCRMGTVVDEDGKLAGYEGIHLCDASVFPNIPAVNTHLPTMMLAERLTARWRRG